MNGIFFTPYWNPTASMYNYLATMAQTTHLNYIVQKAIFIGYENRRYFSSVHWFGKIDMYNQKWAQ